MLRCEDCGRESKTPTGWIAVVLPRMERGRPVLLVYCPDCAVQLEGENVTPLDFSES
jgi:ribosomal protein S27E